MMPITDADLDDAIRWVRRAIAAKPHSHIGIEADEFAALLARLDAAEAERDRLRAAVSAWLAECEPPYAGGNVGLSGAAWRRLTELYHYAAALTPQEAP